MIDARDDGVEPAPQLDYAHRATRARPIWLLTSLMIGTAACVAGMLLFAGWMLLPDDLLGQAAATLRRFRYVPAIGGLAGLAVVAVGCTIEGFPRARNELAIAVMGNTIAVLSTAILMM